jgi:hypothetical protein
MVLLAGRRAAVSWPEPSGRTARCAGGSLAAASTRMRDAPARHAVRGVCRGRPLGGRSLHTRWRGDALTSAPCGALRQRAVRGVVVLRRASERIAGAGAMVRRLRAATRPCWSALALYRRADRMATETRRARHGDQALQCGRRRAGGHAESRAPAARTRLALNSLPAGRHEKRRAGATRQRPDKALPRERSAEVRRRRRRPRTKPEPTGPLVRQTSITSADPLPDARFRPGESGRPHRRGGCSRGSSMAGVSMARTKVPAFGTEAGAGHV